MIFIDLEKGNDIVPRKILWLVLETRVSCSQTEVIKDMYQSDNYCVDNWRYVFISYLHRLTSGINFMSLSFCTSQDKLTRHNEVLQLMKVMKSYYLKQNCEEKFWNAKDLSLQCTFSKLQGKMKQ